MSTKVINTILTLNDKMSKPLINTARNTKQFKRELEKASYTAQKFASNTVKQMDKVAKRVAQLSVVAAGFAAKAVIQQSDAYSGIQARLNLINDGLQTAKGLQLDIYNSAQRSRGAYQDTADTVSKLGLLAGGAFSNTKEIISFVELMNKNFKIAGADAISQSSAMYQLTQAMASGKLQGDEYRSIIENAPLLAKAIEDYMVNVKHAEGSMKDWASEGLLTADVIKAALFNTADEVNKMFEQVPMTFSDAATKIKNQVFQKLQPTFEKLSKWLNSKEGTDTIDKIGDAIAKVAEYTPQAIDAIKRLFDFIIQNKTQIAGAAKSLAVFYIAAKGIQGIGALVKGIKGIGIVAGILAELTPVGLAITGITIAIAGVVAACVVFPEKFKKMKDDVVATAKALKDRVIENFNKLKEFLQHPIKATVEYIEKREERVQAQQSKGKEWLSKVNSKNALGTSYWKGGWTSINERGREIVDLPNGSRVIPADKTNSIMNSRNVSVGNITIVTKGLTSDEVIKEVVPKLKFALENL